jgi:hypothetical protein
MIKLGAKDRVGKTVPSINYRMKNMGIGGAARVISSKSD